MGARAQCLQPAGARRELTQRAAAERHGALGRGPSVEQAVRVGGVLGLVDLTGGRVDRSRFVLEPAEGTDGLRVAVGVLVVGVDLEDVAVPPPQSVAGSGHLVGLLAGEPGLPGRRGPGAVDEGARQAHVLTDPIAAAIDLDGGRAAEGALVVDQARQVRHAVQEAGTHLVVGHQHAAVSTGAYEGCGAVRGLGGDLPALEPGHAGLGDHRVGEPLGQSQASGRVVAQGPVAGVPAVEGVRAGPAGLPGPRCRRAPEDGSSAAGQGDAEAGGSPTEQEAPRQRVVGLGGT